MILFFYVCLGLSILLTSTAQILLKIGARKKTANESVYLNRSTISGYCHPCCCNGAIGHRSQRY